MAAVLTAATPTGGQIPSAPLLVKRATVAMDTSYPTGGEAIDVTAAPLRVVGGIANIVAVIFGDGWQGYSPVFVRSATGLIKLERTDQIDDPREEVPATTDVSVITAGEMIVIHN